MDMSTFPSVQPRDKAGPCDIGLTMDDPWHQIGPGPQKDLESVNHLIDHWSIIHVKSFEMSTSIANNETKL